MVLLSLPSNEHVYLWFASRKAILDGFCEIEKTSTFEVSWNVLFAHILREIFSRSKHKSFESLFIIFLWDDKKIRKMKPYVPVKYEKFSWKMCTILKIFTFCALKNALDPRLMDETTDIHESG